MGDFQQGFSQVAIEVSWLESNQRILCDFNQAPEIENYYNNWRQQYKALEKINQALYNYQRGIISEDDETDNFPSEAERIAQLTARYPEDMAECNLAFDTLQESLNYWLNPIKNRLKRELDLNSEDEINVVIQTQHIICESTKNILSKLPWHCWDFFSQKNFADVAVSFSNSAEVNPIPVETMPESSKPKRVKILCVLGDSTNIDVEADRRLLRKISGAYCVFLRQPTKSEFLNFMEKEPWDMLFFSGHSETDETNNTGLLKLNNKETLNIQEIEETIETAIEQYQRLKLAIFNSCDGLGLARRLAHLPIAQIIVWREPVPDRIAQEFLKSFLEYFTGFESSTPGLSLYRSVQKARLEVQKYINENDNIPQISWLPVIHQNLAKESITWQQLRVLPDTEKPISSSPTSPPFWERVINCIGLEKIGINRKKNSPHESLLNRVEKSWIENVLDKSLHIEETIELGLIERFDAVSYPANIQEENSPQSISKKVEILSLFFLIQSGLYQLALLLLPDYSLPEGTRAIDIFGELENKRTMLILGEPGSGKTTGLLEIAQESIIDARKDQNLPIPVVLNLSSWVDTRQPKPFTNWLVKQVISLTLSSLAEERQPKTLVDWLIQELNRIYLFPKKQCDAWIKNEQLLLLLDGLDEVRENQREACVRAINQFLREYGKTEIVVCCRIDDYNKLSEKLHFQSAVLYKSPTDKQIDRYLDDAKENLSAVKELKKEDKAIQTLLRNPLTLNLIVVAYKGRSREKLLDISSLEERHNHLLNTYIERRFTDIEQSLKNESTKKETNRLQYSKEQSLHWLKWLAQNMTQRQKTQLLIEQIQPDWLETNLQKSMYLIGCRLILGLIVGLIGVFHFGTQVTNNLGMQISLVIPSIIAGLVSCLISLILSYFISRIMPRFISHHHILRFIPGVISGLIYVTIAVLMVYPLVNVKLTTLLSPLMIDGVVLGILLSLIEGEIGIIDTISLSWKQARKYSLVGLFCGSIYVLARWLLSDVYESHSGLHGGLTVLREVKHAPIIVELIIFTTLSGLIGLLDKGLNLEQTIIPNQGIWRSAKNASFFFGIFFLAGAFYGLPYSEKAHEIISIGLAVGLLAGLVGGKGPVFAGVVLIQHFVLRLILWLDGYIPWNYAHFLDYATERIFLRQVGGSYIFLHRMLLDHFAQIKLNEIQQ
ncbi:CHAT domain-containing protein [Aphanothece sacrum]|uniref:CHAT domain-containing protein n=1 Tax=Aphanothece sacrum TaxID=1122 RepID=UPI000F60F9E9|nr:CHAT domain-containing protein [Aphanothece sacrum]GBF86566.1 NACHT nucleoside triphosphatase [Aphanothece sacrum FPU3]